MVALAETISEHGPRRISHGCRGTAEYPQGGTGIPAGEMNCPGAAAQSRYLGTGFHEVDGTNGFGLSPNALNINAPVLQDTYSAGVIQPNYRLYFIQDANWNTTAAIGYDAATGTWNVVQRYVYSPYGNIIILNANWTGTPAGTVPMVNNLYQGMPLDPATGLYYERARWYSPSLGTWISQDPAGYINGADTYQFVGSGPIGRVDAGGAFALQGTLFSADAYDGFGGGVAVDYKVDYEKCRCHPGRHKGSASVTASYHFGVGLGEEVDVLGIHEDLLLRIGPQISGGTTLKLHKVCLGQWAGSESTHLNVGVGIAGSIGGWHLDNGEQFYGKAEYGPGGYPFYAGATVWGYKNPQYLPLVSVDDPGASVPFYHVDWGIEQKFKLYAVVTDGRDKGKSLGYASWGQIIYWGPARFADASGTGVKRSVESFSWSGTAAQSGGVDRNGLAPLPGQITW